MTPDDHQKDWGLTLYLIGCMVPGIVVFAGAFEDTDIVDRASRVFFRIIEEEKAVSGETVPCGLRARTRKR